MNSSDRQGQIKWIGGPVIIADGIPDIQVGEMVEVGNENIIGEVIRISGGEFTVQAYEVTSGVSPGEVVTGTRKQLVAELGPGLLDNTLDGIGRPLETIRQLKGPFVTRGVRINALSREKRWEFKPSIKIGDRVKGGDVLGAVQETPAITHKILLPPKDTGKILSIKQGEYTVDETIGQLETPNGTINLKLMQEWPIRTPRPFKSGERVPLEEQLVTGQRVIDTFFPITKGGTASIPGGFGTGKTVLLHSLAKWSDCDITVYVGCGERGNEIAEVLSDFSKLIDPKNGRPLTERTVIIANTSNMPVAAREASINLGATMAEYYRDQGYHAAIMADSTSRWAEALREISGVLEEMPAEAGYPAYLPDRIAEFYERAAMVSVLGDPPRTGSVSIIGAVSPPGGDLNEPVTIYTLRNTGVFWSLDRDLAYSRHFPAINWLRSYSLYVDRLLSTWNQRFEKYEREEGQDKTAPRGTEAVESFEDLRKRALGLLGQYTEIEAIAKIMGERALPDEQRLVLFSADLIKESFLRQFAFDETDSYCDTRKQIAILQMLIEFHERAKLLVREGVPVEKIRSIPQITLMQRAKFEKNSGEIDRISNQTNDELTKLAREHQVSA